MKLITGTLIAALFALLLSVGLTACNTAKGVGQDVQATGENIEDAAEKAHEEISD